LHTVPVMLFAPSAAVEWQASRARTQSILRT
jgi:hypothetical protein